MKLSEHLTVKEVTKSATAIKHGIDNEPTIEHLENLKALAVADMSSRGTFLNGTQGAGRVAFVSQGPNYRGTGSVHNDVVALINGDAGPLQGKWQKRRLMPKRRGSKKRR